MTEKLFFMKVIKHQSERLVAACDKDIMDVSLYSEGIEIRATTKFYGDKLVDKIELLEELKQCTSANVIGSKVITLLLEHRFIHREAILWLNHPEESKKKIGHAILIK
ncbi:MAG: DUF424 family protein [Candidatus Heimdallarchaeaceae archaeon]